MKWVDSYLRTPEQSKEDCQFSKMPPTPYFLILNLLLTPYSLLLTPYSLLPTSNLKNQTKSPENWY